MRAIVESAIARAGLGDVLLARARRDVEGLAAIRPLLAGQDLLVLGALADRIRALEAGDDVQIVMKPIGAAAVASANGAGNAPGAPGATSVTDSDAPPVLDRLCIARGDGQTADSGLAFLRRVAEARILGPYAARIQVDWDDIGLELAQVALGFGASELLGTLASKRGLPIAEGAMSGSGKKSERQTMMAVKYRELAGFVERAGRRPLFVAAGSPGDSLGATELYLAPPAPEPTEDGEIIAGERAS